MKLSLRNLVFTLFFLIACSLYAQDVSLIISAGANYSDMSVKDGDPTRQIGYRFSVLPEYSLTNDFFIRIGVELSQKRSKIDISRLVDFNGDIYPDYMGIKEKYSPVYLQIPLVVGKRITVNRLKLGLVAGLYYGYGLSGRRSGVTEIISLIPSSISESALINLEDYPSSRVGYYYKFFSPEGFKRSDLGLSLNAEAEYAQFLLRAGYEHGLTNISRGDITVRNRSFFITLGYRLPSF